MAGLIAGFIARLLLLRVDFRQYPTYPHGYLTHLALGFIAAFVGAVAVPALVAREFTAVTFLLLAATEFRGIRNAEREKLRALDELQLVPRGGDYIEGIARVFEARNYLVMAVALITSTIAQFQGFFLGLIIGAAAVIGAWLLRSGNTLESIADIRAAEVRFDGPHLYVEDVYIMNVALKESREKILAWGMGLMLTPRTDNARGILGNVGQRQALLHDITSIMGTRLDVAEPEFTPIARKNPVTGQIGVFVVPAVKDVDILLAISRRVPVLETARGSSYIRVRAREKKG